MKLQDAYAAESNKLGTWTLIGYTAPGTKANDGATSSSTNFKYSSSTTEAVDLTETGAAADGGWIATALVALNDCKASSTWTLNVLGKTTGVTYTAVYGDKNNCEPLTPSFELIGTKAASTNQGS